MSEAGAPNIFLLGVSIPRSGHHFLATLLEQALGADIRYCEDHSKDDCCKDVPCSRARQHRVIYQKNHDMELTLDANLPGVSYLVQFREPIPAVVSDRELFAAVYGSHSRRTRRSTCCSWPRRPRTTRGSTTNGCGPRGRRPSW